MPEEVDAVTDCLRFQVRRVRAGRSLVLEGGVLKSLYFVAAGCFKCIQTHADGHEQVLGFPMRGELIGIDALDEGRYASGALALEDSTVLVLPFRELVRLGQEVPALERMLQRCTGRELARRDRCAVMTAGAGAQARLSRFLLWLAGQQGGTEGPVQLLRLPMSRRDIASHLGLPCETVARLLSTLEAQGCIELRPGELELLDADALEQLQHQPLPVAEPCGLRDRLPQRSRRGRAAGALRMPAA
ncbi:Crp/Fnr family transcriptional regulator [Caldimonas tepidiphila]|uniref:Crp/Fnr family transcriptional regulator n=1 Tax=Caldimonas tepidiphila TaxID=2315841 RepID=UPI001475AAB0|nr:Crp/Fnr family transcriptional regulator [Caldimonas tepidiphila]